MNLLRLNGYKVKGGIMDNIIVALKVMGKGMLGIFIALGIIYLFTLALTKLFPEKKIPVQKSEETED